LGSTLELLEALEPHSVNLRLPKSRLPRGSWSGLRLHFR